jgi:hypothetical protein
MFYRIINAPPGYAPDQKYLVAAYETTDTCSKKCSVTKADGSLFAATIEEARQMIPSNATRHSFEPTDQFLELWEAEDGRSSERPGGREIPESGVDLVR